MNIGGDGYLHGDVSIGNVLRLKKPVERLAFSTRSLELFEPYRRPTADEDHGVMSAMNASAAEEDAKPYVDFPRQYRKRSRSRDGVGTGGSTPKMPRTKEKMAIQDDAASSGAEFITLENIGDASGDDEFWTTLRSNLACANADKYILNVAAAAERLEKALRKLGVLTTCEAVLIDGDRAVRLQTYFTGTGHDVVISVSACASV